MTFDEYNTDENFDKKESSLDELVKLGLEEGKSSDEIKSSLSPKWQKSKKIGEFDNYVTKYSKPKEEVKEAVTEETEPKVEPLKETSDISVEEKTEAPKAKTNLLDKKSKDYMTKQDEIADTALNTTLNDIEERSGYNWEKQYETAKKAGEAYNRIDDKLVAQLPTFLLKRYANGEFGDVSDDTTPEGKESKKNAQLRLAHFLLNGVGSKLKMASNIAMRTAGKAPMFEDTTSDYEKYQQSNFAKGMENRWRKYEAETQNAIDLVTKETGNEQAARLEAEKLANDEKMGTKFRMMSAREKADLINIKMEIGKLVGKMDLSEIADFMTGEAINGDLTKDEAIAIGVAQLVKNSPGLLKQLPEGKYKDAIIGLFGGGDVDSIISSLGGDGNDKEESGEGSGTPKIGLTMDDAEFEALRKRSNELSAKYYNGEMSKEDFITEWDKLYKEMNKHPIYKKRNNVRILSTKEILAANKELELKDKFGEDTKSKTFKEGKKAVDYFNDKLKLFDYFKNTEEPNFIDAKAATKNKDYKMKEYQEALKQYEILKKADATNLVGKY